ncbi:MAG: iron-sulfur cluster carrier protein ApbC [Mariprofundus sp.]|nr:iron-sulfur cluster carrier protein ApbC [Mariprofundus sp.]
MLSEAEVLTALSTIIDPDFKKDIVSLGFVKDIRIDGQQVSLTIELTTPACPVKEEFRRQAEEALLALDGIEKTHITMSSRVTAGVSSKQAIPGIANIIAVASGKGGVGKSTTAVNLAVAMAQTGARVGLLDADIYGPSIPRMMGLCGFKPEVDIDSNKMQPLENYGVKTISIGYLVDENKAMIWRGPMVASALSQLLSDVAWGALDYLFVDMPPGTGDAQLTLSQKVPVTGAVMVTTPQDIALLDCRKGIEMFNQVQVPILGIVENMSQFICPHCGESSPIFSEGGADRLSSEFHTAVLAHIPLNIHIRELSDSGTPVTAALPDSEQALLYRNLAGEIARKISIINSRKINIPVVMQN